MKNEKTDDHFFDFLLKRLEDDDQKTVLKLLKKYPSQSDTRELIRDYIRAKNSEK
jgi:hypothetical protein